jgi:hypothetical protein
MAPCDRREERFKGKEVERTSGIVIRVMRLRLFAARLDPERRLVVVVVLSHVVQDQLRLVRPAESPHHERPGIALCSIVSELRVYLVVQRASWNEQSSKRDS